MNIYFDPVKRGEDTSDLMTEIELQCRALLEIQDKGLSLDEDNTVKRLYRWFRIDCDDKTRGIKSFNVDEKKVSNARRTSGFYAIATLGMDLSAMQAWELYGLRDEQEKYFEQMKTQLGGHDRQRNWSKEGKTGRLFILFVGLILSSYVSHIWQSTSLHKQFSSTLEVLDEMRPIRCIEHTRKAKFMTPFVGAQVDIEMLSALRFLKGAHRNSLPEKKIPRIRDGQPNQKLSNSRVNGTLCHKTHVFQLQAKNSRN